MRRSCPLLLLVALGCAPDEPADAPDPPESGSQEFAPTVRVIAVADDLTRAEVRVPVARSRLAGRYGAGGLGYNLDLDLQADGSFELTEGGCLGAYGTAAGAWHLDSDGVALVTARADGTLAHRSPGRLAVAAARGRYLLVEEADRDLFIKGGPVRSTILDPLMVRGAGGAAAEPVRAPDRGGEK